MLRRRDLTLLVIVLLMLASLGCPRSAEKGKPLQKEKSAAASWPCFHGPKGDNISTETGLLKEWPKDGPTLLWTCKGIGEGFGSPSIANGLIYVSGAFEHRGTITAIDLNGNIRWQVRAGESWTGNYPGMRGTPTVDGERLYHESPNGRVVCLNAKTGKDVWRVDILKEFDAKNITWGLAESVLIDGDRVICCPGGKKGSVVALNKQTGKTVWAAKSTGESANYATPVLAEQQGLRMILTMSQKALIGVNADNGDFLFRHTHETRYDINATSPILHDGRIFITSGYGSGSEMLNLTVNGQKASVQRVWQSKELDNHHGGVILLDGHIYGAAFDRGWTCLAWNDGKKMYADKGIGKGSLTCADGMFYCWSEQGRVGLVAATPNKYDLISSFNVAKGGEGPTWAHPVVCGGRLYLRHGDLLHAYEIAANL
jgi:outer membrane protein assembly factor BamB